MPDLLVYLSLGQFRQAWCDRCNTSAGVRATVYGLFPSGPRAAGDIECCTECDSDQVDAIARQAIERAQVRLRFTGGR